MISVRPRSNVLVIRILGKKTKILIHIVILTIVVLYMRILIKIRTQ